jgi:hypothetical protein
MEEETVLVRWKGVEFAPITIPKSTFDPEVHTLYEVDAAVEPVIIDPPIETATIDPPMETAVIDAPIDPTTAEETLLVRWEGVEFAPITIPKSTFDPEVHTLYEIDAAVEPVIIDTPVEPEALAQPLPEKIAPPVEAETESETDDVPVEPETINPPAEAETESETDDVPVEPEEPAQQTTRRRRQ